MQINKYKIQKNRKLVEHCYKVGDKGIPNNNSACKYETPYKDPFVIKQCWANGMVVLQYGATKIRYDIRRIQLYTPYTNDEYINPYKYFCLC